MPENRTLSTPPPTYNQVQNSRSGGSNRRQRRNRGRDQMSSLQNIREHQRRMQNILRSNHAENFISECLDRVLKLDIFELCIQEGCCSKNITFRVKKGFFGLIMIFALTAIAALLIHLALPFTRG